MPATEVNLLGRLDALAARIPEGLWLTGVLMADQGQTLTVDGHALEARLVPDWLNRLSRAPEFSGMGFRRINLTERADDQPGIRFSVSTTAEDNE